MSQNKTLLHEACDLSLCSIRGMPKKTNRCINVSGKEFVDFATGSYLGMEHIKEYQDFAVDTIRNYGLGSRSSPLYVASEYYTMIESKVSKITSLPKVIIFNSCTLANQAIIRYALPSNCHFLIDEFAHRSLIEPIKNKNTKMSRYRHVNINDMENKLVNMPSNVPKAIISDGVFSMSGQTAPIKDLLEIAKKYNCYLVIDDTHGFAINGQMGEGSLSGLGKYDDSNVIYIGSLSKALPGVGGFVACSEAIGNRICCRSSQYGFSCCLPFLYAAISAKACKDLGSAKWKKQVRKLNENWDILNSCIKANNRELKGEFAPMAVLCARNEAEMRKICLCLKADKILFNIVGFPAIPKNEFRIRFCLSAAHTRVEMDCLVRSLNRSMH